MVTRIFTLLLLVAIATVSAKSTSSLEQRRMVEAAVRRLAELRREKSERMLPVQNPKPDIVERLMQLSDHEEGITDSARRIVFLLAHLLVQPENRQDFVRDILEKGVDILQQHGGVDGDDSDTDIETTPTAPTGTSTAPTTQSSKRMKLNAGGPMSLQNSDGIIDKLNELVLGSRVIHAILEAVVERLEDVVEDLEDTQPDPNNDPLGDLIQTMGSVGGVNGNGGGSQESNEDDDFPFTDQTGTGTTTGAAAAAGAAGSGTGTTANTGGTSTTSETTTTSTTTSATTTTGGAGGETRDVELEVDLLEKLLKRKLEEKLLRLVNKQLN